MAPLLEDPRFRQTWNQFSQNAEEATETAATSIWNFQHRYLNPCFASIGECFAQTTASCFPSQEERARRTRSRTRGRAELSFDFYDDWDEDDFAGRSAGGGLLGGWGNDELDRLLAGSGSTGGRGGGETSQPKRKRGMSYGTRGKAGRRKSLEADPTVIPSTNTLGFLGRLPFKLGGTLRYKPSAADLQEHPGSSRAEFRGEEGEPLIDSDEEGSEREDNPATEEQWRPGHRRNRSSTASSGETSDSFRSRGDIFPSDGEDDAVPLDDEFAMVLERRMTGDERSSGKTKSSKGKRPAGSRTISRTYSRTNHSSNSRPRLDGHRSTSASSLALNSDPVTPDKMQSSFSDLREEEERIRLEEEDEIENKRQAAAKLAIERGLSVETEDQIESVAEFKEQSGQEETATAILEEPVNGDEIAQSAPIEGPNNSDPHPIEDSIIRDAEALSIEAPKSPEPPKANDPFVPARLPHFR